VIAILCQVGCSLPSAEQDPVFNRELRFRYSAFDSTGFKAVAGSIKFKVDLLDFGCRASKCGDIDGSWDFASTTIPPIVPHPVGAGRFDGILTDEFVARIPIGPDGRDHSIVVEFQLPLDTTVVGTWSASTGEGGAVELTSG
jgi:hypothetical protein